MFTLVFEYCCTKLSSYKLLAKKGKAWGSKPPREPMRSKHYQFNEISRSKDFLADIFAGMENSWSKQVNNLC